MIRLVLAVVAGLLVLPDYARAQDPTRFDDPAPDGCLPTDCSLREAVDAVVTGQTIVLQAGRYELTGGQLMLDDTFTVRGAGARATTIDGNSNDRIGYVAAFSHPTFEDLTVTGGRADGEAAPQPHSGGAFAVNASGGELRLLGVTLVDNVATGRGGAIANFGNLSFTESTASGNRAGSASLPTISGQGGAIYHDEDAGIASFLNSTLSGNTAVAGEGFSFGGGMWVADNFNADFLTIADNTAVAGAGLFKDDTASAPDLTNTLLADNNGEACGGIPGALETLVEHHNLADDNSCDFDGEGDLQGVDADIGALADNGGQTDTHGLLADSPAIGTADQQACIGMHDQRLFPRPQPAGGTCDIGAFEGVLGTDFLVTADHDNPGTSCTAAPNDCTVRDALLEAGPDDAVILQDDTYVVENGPLPLEGDTIVGAGARDSVIEATAINSDRVLNVTAGANEVAGVTITGGREPGAPAPTVGGGILVNGPASLLMSNVTVTNNEALSGGGIGTTNGGSLTISRSTISRNRANEANNGVSGGGLWLNGTTTQLTNVTISGNLARGAEGSDAEGGGIKIIGGSLTTNNVTIADNGADTGSAIHREPLPASTVSLVNTIVEGGGLFAVCAGGPFANNHNLFSHSSCGSPARAPGLVLPLDDNGGQTDTVEIAATSPAVDGGVNCDSTDQRGMPRKRACDIGAYEFQGNLPPSGGGGPSGPPPPPPDDDEELPPPEAGKNVNALRKSGTVRIKLPGSDEFIELVEGQQIPVGTIVDARKGRVTLIAAGGGEADFYGGIFKIGQTKGAKPLTTLSLVEKLACPKKQATTAAKKKKKRRLWGDGRGRFRTKGKHSAATVVGTKWLVQDKCASTLTRVVRGKVRVRDFVKKQTVTVKAGKKYVAKAKP